MPGNPTDDGADQAPETLEDFWDAILSRDPGRIRAAYKTLDASERKYLLEHLTNMATQEGWHPEQRQSALTAIKTMTDQLE